MGILLKAILNLIKQMVRAYIDIKAVNSMKEIGLTIFNMVMVLRSSKMDPYTKEISEMVRNKEEALILGQMEHIMKVNGQIIKLRAKVFISGQMVDFFKELGKKINSMVVVSTHGLTGGDTKVNIKKIRSTDTVFIFGLMAKNMKASGLMGSNTGKANLQIQRDDQELEYGLRVSDRNGFRKTYSGSRINNLKVLQILKHDVREQEFFYLNIQVYF